MINMQTIPFLAQYSIRSKQAYIFRTNRLAEIIGGSELIADAFKLLFDCAEELNLKLPRATGQEFIREEILAQFEAGSLDLVELFRGGGNDTILFRDQSVFARLNRAYTLRLLRECPGMIPLCVGTALEECRDYDADYKRLMQAADREKNRMLTGGIPVSQPFAMMDRTTFQPLSKIWAQNGKEYRRSDEAYAKLNAGWQSHKTDLSNAMLDGLVTEKDEESLLAIVHADGNNMGVKIQNMLDGHSDYDYCVKAMREFTEEISKVFSVSGKKAVDECAKAAEQAQLFGLKQKNSYKVRWVVCDGDDATFICNARLAKLLAEEYLKAVDQYRRENKAERYSSCAGICIFHSHYPVDRAYALAEQACDSAKDPIHAAAIRAKQKKQPVPEEGWLDFHYIRGGMGDNLDEIRDRHGVSAILARPWKVCGGADDHPKNVKKLDALAETLLKAKFNRSNLKAFGAAYEEDQSLGELEWERATRMLEKDKLNKINAVFSDKAARFRALYDLSEVYDLWYRPHSAAQTDEEG
jgi:hypothetical protein